jgi:predicted O-methyltransferase YrrM
MTKIYLSGPNMLFHYLIIIIYFKNIIYIDFLIAIAIAMLSLKIDYKASKSELCEIGRIYDTDKTSQRDRRSDVRHCHPYTLFYHDLFHKYRHLPLKIAEIGILHGASLLMWRDYFPNAQIYGFEYDQNLIDSFKRNFNNDRIHLFNINVKNTQSIIHAFNLVMKEDDTLFDFIIDDSTHEFSDQIRVIQNIHSFLKAGGLLIIEDIFKSRNELDYGKYLNKHLNNFQDYFFVTLDHVNRISTGWNNDKLFLLIKKDAEPIFKNTNKLTIITPSYRTDNLYKIKDFIQFDKVDQWIIVYDGNKIIENPLLFKNDPFSDKIKEYVYQHGKGASGNPQRNYALSLLHDVSENTFIYYLDDDNLIHPTLFRFLSAAGSMIENKMITFDQKKRLKGDNITPDNIDTAMLLIDFQLCKDIQWINELYNADGLYICECYNNNKEKHIYINNDMCFYYVPFIFSYRLIPIFEDFKWNNFKSSRV